MGARHHRWGEYAAVQGPNSGKVLSGASVSLQADPVEAMNLCSVTLSHEVRRNVLTHHSSGTDHRHIAESHELVDPGEPTNDDAITDDHVPGQRRTVGEYAPITNQGVVTDVRVCHEQILIADPGYHPAATRSWLKSHALPDDVAITDDQLARLTSVLQVLRNCTNRRELKERISIADRSMPLNHNMRTNVIIATKNHIRADN
jgi:hypothetical protein